MPRYEITGPDGHRYEVTAPEGATEQDILARVQAEAGERAPAAPTEQLSPSRHRLGAAFAPANVKATLDPVAEGYKSTAESVRNALTMGEPGWPVGNRRGAATPLDVASTLIPDNLLGAGAMALSGGLGAAARGAGSGVQALMSILGGALGGEAGNLAEGGPVGKGAAIGGGGAAAGELVGKTLPWLYRGLSGQKQAIGDQQAARVGEVFAKRAPGLGQATTSEALRDLASGPGRVGLGQAKEAAVQGIEALTQRQPLSIQGQPMGLREANDLLSAIGEKLKNKLPSERTFAGRDAALAYRELAQEIESGLRGLSPAAADQWVKAQGEYQAGSGILSMLRKAGVFLPERDRLVPGAANIGSAAGEILRGKGGAPQIPALIPRSALPNLGSEYATEAGVTFNAGNLQAFAQTPKGKEFLMKKLGPEGYAELMGALFPGRTPYAPSAGMQPLLDMLGIAGADALQP